MNMQALKDELARLSKENGMKMLSHLDNCRVLSTVSQEEDEEKWLENRGLGIGGSDVGAICGVNKWSSPRLVFLKKTGQYTETFSDEAKERMEWGHLLEPIVADKFAKKSGKNIAVCPATLAHKDFPWAIANIDRLIVDDHGVPYGVLECKTANFRLNEEWDDGEIPLSYVYQLMWYLWVTGLKYGAFACLVGTNKYHYYEVFINDELLESEIIPTVSAFWNDNVLKLTAPGLSGSEADSDFIKEMYAAVIPKSEISLTDTESNDLVEAIVYGKAEIKKLEAVVEEASNKLKERIGLKEVCFTKDYVVKWSPRTRTGVDSDILKVNFPHVFEQCKKVTHYRQMTIK